MEIQKQESIKIELNQAFKRNLKIIENSENYEERLQARLFIADYLLGKIAFPKAPWEE